MIKVKIRRWQRLERSIDERAFLAAVHARAQEAWRDYLRSAGLPPYPGIEATYTGPMDIELVFEIE